MTTSQVWVSSAAARSSAVSTRSHSSLKPARWRAISSKAASLSESSTSNTRNCRFSFISCFMRHWFVQHKPIKSKLTYGVNKRTEINGLLDITVGSEFVSADDIFFFVGRSEDDDGDV